MCIRDRAYGTAKKSAYTGAASEIKSAKIEARQISNVSAALVLSLIHILPTVEETLFLFINLHFRKGLKILETGIAPFLCILQLLSLIHI